MIGSTLVHENYPDAADHHSIIEVAWVSRVTEFPPSDLRRL